MKLKIEIENLSKEDIVELLSTALFGSNIFAASFPEDETTLPADSECFEDKAAKHLLSGGHINIIDYYASDEDEVYNDKIGKWNEKEECADYKVDLQTIIDGLNKAANGTFSVGVNKYSEMEKRSVRQAFFRLVDSEDGKFDAYDAEMLMQIILFDEVIYG